MRFKAYLVKEKEETGNERTVLVEDQIWPHLEASLAGFVIEEKSPRFLRNYKMSTFYILIEKKIKYLFAVSFKKCDFIFSYLASGN